MKTKLTFLIEQAIELLNECGYSEKAIWFENKLKVLCSEGLHSTVFKDTISEIKGIMGGMGSFSDLSMIPKPEAKLSRKEARERQWDLTEDIYEEITLLLKE